MILLVKAVEDILEFGPKDLKGDAKTSCFSSLFDIFTQFFDHIHSHVVSDLGVEILQSEDEFFDYFMTFFEKINDLKPSLKKYLLRALKAPSFYSEHMKTLVYMSSTLKGILPQIPESHYYTTLAILPAVFYVWLQDDSDDLRHTMKKLQQVSSSFSQLTSDY